MHAEEQPPQASYFADLLSRYQPLDGVMDEMMDANGELRAVWQPLINTLSSVSEKTLQTRFARSAQYLHDAGVYYRIYDRTESRERVWPLADIPLVLDESQWRTVEQGIVQRAELLEQVVADIYGPNNLVRNGLIAPALIGGNPEFLRPMVGIQPVGGHHLHFCAFELGRGPDGQWWVLGDRTQAASGAGFALENRVAMSRSFSDTIARQGVHRLAGFFDRFKQTLTAYAGNTDGLTAILTPGAWNETYYEHAYIARYLGMLLIEGEDLVVHNGDVMVRTITGLRPISLLWRRLDGAFADPLELNSESFIGTPGLVHALRRNSTAMINAIGSGVVEMRALSAFLPAIAQHFLGQSLKLPTIATWWCGQTTERDHVLQAVDKMLIGKAMSTQMPFENEQSAILGARLNSIERESLADELGARGHDYVGQEPVQLSTAPVFVDGRLEPRPLILRVFAARDENGWSVMPGGLARLGHSVDSAAISMQLGGQAADVWVVSDAQVAQRTLLASDNVSFVRQSQRILPSPAAENLLWLGRYVERCEQNIRALRAYQARLVESEDPVHPLLESIRDYLEDRGVEVDQPLPDGLVRNINSALHSAGRIRDRFSSDGWIALNDMARTTRRLKDRVVVGDDAVGALTVLLRKINGFSGLVHENMYQSDAWRFLELGRRLERAIRTASLANVLLTEDSPGGSAELMLEIGDSVMTYRRFYSVGASRVSVLDLMMLDPTNPRSVVYQTKKVNEVIRSLPSSDTTTELSSVARESLQVHSSMTVEHADTLTEEKIAQCVHSLLTLCNTVASTYF